MEIRKRISFPIKAIVQSMIKDMDWIIWLHHVPWPLGLKWHPPIKTIITIRRMTMPTTNIKNSPSLLVYCLITICSIFLACYGLILNTGFAQLINFPMEWSVSFNQYKTVISFVIVVFFCSFLYLNRKCLLISIGYIALTSLLLVFGFFLQNHQTSEKSPIQHISNLASIEDTFPLEVNSNTILVLQSDSDSMPHIQQFLLLPGSITVHTILVNPEFGIIVEYYEKRIDVYVETTPYLQLYFQNRSDQLNIIRSQFFRDTRIWI